MHRPRRASRRERAATIERLFAEYRHSRVLDEAHYRLAEMLDAREDYPAAAKEYQTVAPSLPTRLMLPTH